MLRLEVASVTSPPPPAFSHAEFAESIPSFTCSSRDFQKKKWHLLAGGRKARDKLGSSLKATRWQEAHKHFRFEAPSHRAKRQKMHPCKAIVKLHLLKTTVASTWGHFKAARVSDTGIRYPSQGVKLAKSCTEAAGVLTDVGSKPEG